MEDRFLVEITDTELGAICWLLMWLTGGPEWRNDILPEALKHATEFCNRALEKQ
jgi:hypothetical protein